MADITKLFTVPTTDEIVSSFWSSTNLPASKIRSLGIINQIVNGFAIGCSSLWRACQNIVTGLGDIRTSRAAWLDAFASGFYDLTRQPASPTIGSVNITTTATVFAITLQSNTTGVTYTYTNVAGLTAGTYTGVQFVAQTSGAVGNVNLSDIVCTTANVTLSATNPTDQSWITSLGTDQELDAQLMQRCLDVVALNGYGNAETIAAKLRLLTNGQIARVFVKFSVGTVTAYVAGPSGNSPSAANTLANSYIALYTSPFTSVATVTPATPVTVRLIGVVSYQQGTPQSSISDLRNKMTSWMAQLPIVTNQNDGTTLILSDIVRQLLALDDAKIVRFPSFYATANGVIADRMTDPLPASPGSMYSLDLSLLQTVFQ